MTTALGNGAHVAADVPFRNRLLDGLGTSIGERGYRDTTVADIVRHARTSKRTFYEQFASKEECLIELLRRNNENLIASIRATVDPEADWQAQIRQAAGAYVDHIASRPAITLSWIREAPALGAAAVPLHRLAMEHLTDMLVDLSDSPGFPARATAADIPAAGAHPAGRVTRADRAVRGGRARRARHPRARHQGRDGALRAAVNSEVAAPSAPAAGRYPRTTRNPSRRVPARRSTASPASR